MATDALETINFHFTDGKRTSIHKEPNHISGQWTSLQDCALVRSHFVYFSKSLAVLLVILAHSDYCSGQITACKQKKSIGFFPGKRQPIRRLFNRGAFVRGAFVRGVFVRGAFVRGASVWGASVWDSFDWDAIVWALFSGAYLAGTFLSGAILSPDSKYKNGQSKVKIHIYEKHLLEAILKSNT